MKTAVHRVIENLRVAAEGFHVDTERAITAFRPLYRDDMTFQDPFHTQLVGWDAFAAMNRRLAARWGKMRWTFHELVGEGEQGFLSWTIDISPRLLPSMKLDGTTHIKLREGRIAMHRDYWDLLGSFMSTLPVAPVYRNLIKRLA
jgi:hypothetical protein